MHSPTSSLRIFVPEPEPAAAGSRCAREAPCDLCGEADFEMIARRDRWGRNLPTVVCRACGLVSHATIPSDEELQDYYQRQYRRDYHGATTPAPHRVVRAWRRGANLVSLLAERLQPCDGVLEIGAGLGCTVKQFELAGFVSSGIEPGSAFQEFSREQLRARVEPGTWSSLRPGPQYQLILMVHVIEHLNSPRAALTHLRKLLAPGGFLYVECPNLNSPHAAPGRLFHKAHVYNFTPATLTMLGRSCGYRVEERFSHERDRNLAFLLSRATRTDDTLLAGSYAQTKAALARYNNLTYHLRAGYLAERLRGLSSNLSDHWRAQERINEIVALCQRRSERSVRLPKSRRRAA